MSRRKKHREAARRKTRQKKLIPVVMMAAGVLLLGGAALQFFGGAQPDAALLEYTPGDVAHDGAFVAVHEMEAGPPVPFLPKDQPQPDIVVPEKFFSFGTIGPTEVVQHKFIVRNEGDAPLTISRAYTTCGCTTAEFSANVIPPGKVAEVTLIFDAGFHDTAGQTVRRGIIIENNDPRESQAEIWVQATVRSG